MPIPMDPVTMFEDLINRSTPRSFDPLEMSPEQRVAFLGYPAKPSAGRLQEYFDAGGRTALQLQESASSNG